jgi:hypothetical protein
MPSVTKDHLTELERAAFLLGQIVEETDPCRYEGTGCVTHDLEMVPDPADPSGPQHLVCPVTAARDALGLEPNGLDIDTTAPSPDVAIRLSTAKRTIEIDGRAWHLNGRADGALVLGEETYTVAEITARTAAMLDAIVAWHDEYAPDGSGRDDDLADTIAGWREVSGR